jgi:hypothetical protein
MLPWGGSGSGFNSRQLDQENCMTSIDRFLEVRKQLEDVDDPLERFVYVYGNCKDGKSLGLDKDTAEVLLFEIWLMAVNKLDIRLAE